MGRMSNETIDPLATLEGLRTYIHDIMRFSFSLEEKASNGEPDPAIARGMWNSLTDDLAQLAQDPPAGVTNQMEILEMFRDDFLALCRSDLPDPWGLEGAPHTARERLFRFCTHAFDLHANLMRYIDGEVSELEDPVGYGRAQWYEIQKAIEDLWEFDLSERERRRLTLAYQKTASMWRQLSGGPNCNSI